MSRRCPFGLATVFVTAALVSSPGIVRAQADRYTLAGDAVAVYNLAGEVRVEPATGADVAVQLARGGGDAAKLRVEQGTLDGVNTLRIVYPSDRIVYPGLGRHSETQLHVREDGTFGGDSDDDSPGHRRRHGREEGRKVRIEGGGDGLEAHADLRVGVPKGRRVALHLAVGAVLVQNVDGRLHIEAANAPVTTTDTRGGLDIDVGSGDVKVTGNQGDLLVDTGSGSVTVSGTHGDNLSIDTGSGEVHLTTAEARSAKVDTGSGDVTLAELSAGTLRVDTGSGNVELTLATIPSAIDVDTGSGDITIAAPASLGAVVSLQTSSGDIETDFPVAITRHGDDELRGTIGDGKGRIAVETGSGTVRLRRR